MTDAERIDAALREIRGRDETRSQPEKERHPGWYQRQQPADREPRGWDGGSFGGRNWGGGRDR